MKKLTSTEAMFFKEEEKSSTMMWKTDKVIRQTITSSYCWWTWIYGLLNHGGYLSFLMCFFFFFCAIIYLTKNKAKIEKLYLPNTKIRYNNTVWFILHKILYIIYRLEPLWIRPVYTGSLECWSTLLNSFPVRCRLLCAVWWCSSAFSHS